MFFEWQFFLQSEITSIKIRRIILLVCLFQDRFQPQIVDYLAIRREEENKRGLDILYIENAGDSLDIVVLSGTGEIGNIGKLTFIIFTCTVKT